MVAAAKPVANVRAESGSVALAEMWSRVMDAVESVPSIAVVAESMTPVERRGSVLRLARPSSGVRFTDLQRERLEGVVESVFGARMRVEVVEAAPRGNAEADDGASAPGEREMDAAVRAEAMNHPVVKKATELFGAKLIRVEPAE